MPVVAVELPGAGSALAAEPAPTPVVSPAVEPAAAPVVLPAVEPAAPPPVVPGEITIERFAEIFAEISEGRAERSVVLEAHGLDERAWSEVERRWRTSIDKEIGRGGGELSAEYHSAYVEAVERLRGLITVAEYARITIALEQGYAYDVLDELKIQRPALMPMMDLWARKLATDAALARKARVLLAALRAR
jgi:hypothetical protein